MSTLTDTLIKDHRDCDQTYSQAENLLAAGDRTAASEAFERFVADTDHHFLREEQVLFPEFERMYGHSMGPTSVMRDEHNRMRQLFREMTASLHQGDRDTFLGLGETLFIMLQQHNGKEEQVLYPMLESLFTGREVELAASFQALAD
jgi:hemerythrin-like domain-containing protein